MIFKFSKIHPFSNANLCIKISNYQVKWYLDVEQIFEERPVRLCDLKINGDHVLSKSIHDTKFGNFKSEGSKILSGKHLYKDQQFDLELWTCDLKVSSKHLLSWDIHCITFGNFSAKGIKYWASITCPTDRPKDRQVQYNMAPIFKGDQNWIVLIFTIGSNRLWRSFKQNKISSNLYWKILGWNNPSNSEKNSEFGILPLIWTPF